MVIDPLAAMQARIAAQEYVLKFALQVMHQLAPNSGMQAAMHEMLANSLEHANFEGPPSLKDDVMSLVRTHAAQIIDAGFGAKPVSNEHKRPRYPGDEV